jgi:cyclophilin family peptidyl-prolyl cis-trans isomerase
MDNSMNVVYERLAAN